MGLRVFLLLVATAGAAVVFAGPVSASPTVFTGTWQAIDDDGSLMTLTVSGSGSTVDVVLRDHYTGCEARFGAAARSATIEGTGTISGTTLTFNIDLFRCTNWIIFPDGATQQYFYDAATGTLFTTTASFGGAPKTWYRIGPPLEHPPTP